MCNSFYAQFETTIQQWASRNADVLAIVVVGSRARKVNPADKWSDLDLFIYVTDANKYLGCKEWLCELGDLQCAFLFKTAGDDAEYLTIYEKMHQADFVVYDADDILHIEQAKYLPTIFARGYHILVDKIGLSQKLAQLKEDASKNEISSLELNTILQMFWFGSFYIAKQLLRGEIWVAKQRDAEMKTLLLQIIEIWVKINNPNIDIWHAGKFMQEWLDEDIYAKVKDTFAGFGLKESYDALYAMCLLVKELSDCLCQIYELDLNLQENILTYIVDNTMEINA